MVDAWINGEHYDLVPFPFAFEKWMANSGSPGGELIVSSPSKNQKPARDQPSRLQNPPLLTVARRFAAVKDTIPSG